MSELISIIIPVYNRENLVRETLESILSQTYQNWECIVVDDGSTDATVNVVSAFAETDSRISCYKRPENRLKGANACRNYGFEKSKGDFVVWFDSDDIMIDNYLELHLEPLIRCPHNFSISRFDNVLENGELIKEPMFLNNTSYPCLNGNLYLKQLVFFGTINVLFKKTFVKDFSWNEFLLSGQEYNFFSKVLITTRETAVYIDHALSRRLIHRNSIQSNQNRDEIAYLENKFICYYQTLIDTYDYLEQDELQYLINHCLSFYYRLTRYKPFSYRYKKLRFVLGHLTSYKRYLFQVSLFLNKHFGKGYFLYKKSTFKKLN
jgi:glycosyltransferase involved in cell wall biosynthesis